VSRILTIVFSVMLAASSSISYFQYQRRMQPIGATGQYYIVVDENIFAHARQDLADVRLLDKGKVVPYKLEKESGGSQTQQRTAQILQPGSVAGKTQFFLDLSAGPEYDRVTLRLATKNFVAHARVEGQDDLHGKAWASLGSTTVYDLSSENLGHNSTLQFPLSAYRYLKVTFDGAVKPADVQQATVGVTYSEESVWRDVRAELKQEQHEKETILTLTVPANTPVERAIVEVDPSQANFRRAVQFRDSRDVVQVSSEITRVHILRNGQKVDFEQTNFSVCPSCAEPEGTAAAPETSRIVIHNGDDPPLKITGVRLQQYERRIYFNATAGAQPVLFYGDAKLEPPQYDYAKLFQKDSSVQAVALNNEEVNAVRAERPDERPWSERHPAMLWVAILAAVAILGGIAARSLTSGSSQPSTGPSHE
jgi:uncharacterized protein DUF3999